MSVDFRWRVPTILGTVWIGRWGVGRRELAVAAAVPLAGNAAVRAISGWLDAGGSRTSLVEMVAAVEPGVGIHPHTSSVWLAARVRDALRDGRLVACLVERASSGVASGASPGVAPRAPTNEQRNEKKTFVAIELVDADGKPVPFRRYRIEIPDHSTQSGMLDDRGRALVDGIDPGTCRVTFSDFHPDNWRAG